MCQGTGRLASSKCAVAVGLGSAVRKRSKDPDTVIVEWLRYGAPVGVVAPIHSGGLLPLISESPELVPDSLFELAACDCNNLAST